MLIAHFFVIVRVHGVICNAIWCDVTWRDMIWWDGMGWYMVFDVVYDTMLCGVVLCGKVWCHVIWWDGVGLDKVGCYAVWYDAMGCNAMRRDVMWCGMAWRAVACGFSQPDVSRRCVMSHASLKDFDRLQISTPSVSVFYCTITPLSPPPPFWLVGHLIGWLIDSLIHCMDKWFLGRLIK